MNSKPNTLQGILTKEKDKTDRQGYEFSLRDMTVESLNTYNDCFFAYKQLIEKDIITLYEYYLEIMGNFEGFIINMSGDLIYGSIPGKEMSSIVKNTGKKLKSEYHGKLTVSCKKRT